MRRVPALFACFLVSVAGCARQTVTPTHTAATPQPALKPAPATPLAKKADELGEDIAWTPAYDAFVEAHLPADLLSTGVAGEVRAECPAYAALNEADRRAFWAYTFQAIAAAEAGLQPTADVRHMEATVHVRDEATHRISRQEGLMQVKYEDGDRYGCDFNPHTDARLPERSPERTILQPQRNLLCGLKIMENQIVTQGKPLVVRSSYWATLQPGTRSYRVFAKQMANAPATCGARPRAGRGPARPLAAGE